MVKSSVRVAQRTPVSRQDWGMYDQICGGDLGMHLEYP